MIRLENVSKNYGPQEVLRDINLTIESGEIVGLLGRNGAGKTTLMRIITTYIPPTQGSVSVDDMDVRKYSKKIRSMIGYLPENPPLYDDMTVNEYLRFAARLKDIPSKRIQVDVERALTTCQLRSVADKPIEILSKGFKQRVGIAQSVLHNPQILILDEPTTGLDPIQIEEVRQLIRNLEKTRTVILSTHVLTEIEQMAKRVVIIDQGSIVKDGDLGDLLKDGRRKLEEIFFETVK